MITTIKHEFNELKTNWSSWKWWKDVYRRRIFSHFLRQEGIYVYDERWDNLIVLDACRYDTFKEFKDIEGRLEFRISRGSASAEFLLENFAKHPVLTRFMDVVYVAANPYVSALLPDKFYRIYPVWDYGWDDNLCTVPPGIVAEEALRAREEYPDKRLIVHFMQPHFPSLTGRLAGETGIAGLKATVQAQVDPLGEDHRPDTTVETLLEKGELNASEVWSAYKANLRIVLSHAGELAQRLPGRTVVTSDHGDLFGERQGVFYPFKMYGHPEGMHVKSLVMVPWLIVDNLTTRMNYSIEKREPLPDSVEDDVKIKDRLRKLGYL